MTTHRIWVRRVTVTEFITTEPVDPAGIEYSERRAQNWEEVRVVPIENKVVLVMPA